MKLTSITFEELMAQLPTLTEQEDKDWLALRFSINQLSEKECDALFAAAIPHWFDVEYLNALLENPLSEEEFNSLLTLSFVEPFSARGENTYNIHEYTRKLLLKKLWEQDQPLYKKLSRKAARYCRRHHQDDVNWLMESYYHTLLIDTQDMTEKLFKLGQKWKGQHEFRKLELLTRSISNLVESGKITGNAAAMFYVLQGMSDGLLGNYISAKENFELALQQENIDKHIKASCLLGLGTTYYILDEYLSAKDYIKQALHFFEILKEQLQKAKSLFLLGKIYFYLSEYEASQQSFKQSLSLYKKMKSSLKTNNLKNSNTNLLFLNEEIGDCIQGLGDTAAKLNDYKVATQYYEAALSLYQSIQDKKDQVSCIRSLGDIALKLSDYELAKQRYEQALSMYEDIQDKLGQANCIRRLGDIALKLSDYELAKQRYEQASSIFEDIQHKLGQANCIQGLGDLAFDLSNYEVAQQRYEQALPIYQAAQNKLSQAICYWKFGLVSIATTDFEKALKELQQAIQIFNKTDLKREELICLVMVSALQNDINLMLNQLDNLLKDGINLTKFVVEFRQILKVCEKYPDKPAFVELRKRIEGAINEC